MNRVTMTIDGMMCGMCEAHICDALRRVCDPKAKVSASHTAGTAEILLEGAADVARLKMAVKETGYRVLEIRVEPVESKKKGLFGLFGR